MVDDLNPYCPECEDQPEPFEAFEGVDRRDFIRVVGENAMTLTALGTIAALTPNVLAADAAKTKAVERPTKPAEGLVQELRASLTEEQKAKVILPYDHSKGNGFPTRLGMYNSPIGKTIGDCYTKPQQELIDKILRAISSDEEGYRRLTRNYTFDGSRSLQGCGANLFGDPANGKPYAWVFTGHHITVRCDGNFSDGIGFGGPMYYGHSPNGYSDRNCFNYQTKSVLSVFDALNETQRKKAVVAGTPGEQAPSVRFRKKGEPRPGIGIGELTKDHRELVEKVMRDILSPYRKEDADEVMQIIQATGGMDKIHLAFYEDGMMNDKQPWHFWRLEGPGFIWNYRVLPHVHTYVNIASKVS